MAQMSVYCNMSLSLVSVGSGLLVWGKGSDGRTHCCVGQGFASKDTLLCAPTVSPLNPSLLTFLSPAHMLVHSCVPSSCHLVGDPQIDSPERALS